MKAQRAKDKAERGARLSGELAAQVAIAAGVPYGLVLGEDGILRMVTAPCAVEADKAGRLSVFFYEERGPG